MYQSNRILALIPARGGSKGIKDKNIKPLCGKPLIAYSVECALQSRYVDRVVVTTDSERIAHVAAEWGADVPFLRPAALAGDTAKTVDAVVHALTALQTNGEHYDAVVLLQPTQPLRSPIDVDGAIETFYDNHRQGVVSVCEVADHPLLIRTIDEGRLHNLLSLSSTCRRQDMPPYYRVNGCVYINAVDQIDTNTGFNDNPIPYVMPRERSVDIDTQADFDLAEWRLAIRQKERGGYHDPKVNQHIPALPTSAPLRSKTT